MAVVRKHLQMIEMKTMVFAMEIMYRVAHFLPAFKYRNETNYANGHVKWKGKMLMIQKCN